MSVVKKHIPAIISSFDLNAPSEYAMFLKTLAFQTGHIIQTHSQPYALDNVYPAKLQPDLIDRYYQSSLLWHRFLLLGDGDPVLFQCEEGLEGASSETIEYSPDLHLVPQDDEPEGVEIEVGSEGEVGAQAIDERKRPQQERVPVRKQPTRTTSRKRKPVDIFEDTVSEGSETHHVPVRR